VISGYLIGGHIQSDLREGTFHFLAFYQRRAKRILPALYVLLASLLLIGLIFFSPFELRDFSMYASATLTSVSNIVFWKKLGYFTPQADDNPLLMTWSLGVEEQFYLLIPLIMALFSRVRQRLVLPMIGVVIATSFGFAWFQSTRDPLAAFYLLHSRAWELGVGVGLAILESEVRRLPLREPGLVSNLAGFVGLGLMTVPIYLVGRSTPFPGPAAMPSVTGSALLLASKGSGINRKLLSIQPLVFIGRVSYSWYLWHWPIFALLRMLRGRTIPPSWSLRAALLSFGLAVFSYYCVERPFRGSTREAGSLLVRYGAISLTFLVVTSLIWKTGGLGNRYPVLDSIDKVELNFQRDPCLALAGEMKPRLTLPCSESSSSIPKVALWGDSHAAALADALRLQVAKQGYSMEEYAKNSCAPLIGVARYDPVHLSHVQECITYNDAVLRRLVTDPKVRVVVLHASWAAPFNPHEQLVVSGKRPATKSDQKLTAEILERSLRSTIKPLRDAGKQVVVFGDVPSFKVDPLWRMRTSRIPAREKILEALDGGTDSLDPGRFHANDDTPQARRAQVLVKQTALAIAGVTYWELRAQMCTSREVCLYRFGNTPYYVDVSHISPDGGRKALEGWSVPEQGSLP
jgi:peptidoglycan/LPS O-acetylase OafA/YrhL